MSTEPEVIAILRRLIANGQTGRPAVSIKTLLAEYDKLQRENANLTARVEELELVVQDMALLRNQNIKLRERLKAAERERDKARDKVIELEWM